MTVFSPKWFASLAAMFLCVSDAVVAQQAMRPPEAPVFRSRGGWSVRYPVGWHYFSCHNCPDPTAPDLYVMFAPRRGPGSIMVEPLADRPPNKTRAEWLDATARESNLNRITAQLDTTAGGLPARRVRYSDDVTHQEMEVTYVTAGSRMLSISLFPDASETHLEQLPVYSFYRAMLASLTFRPRRAGAPRRAGLARDDTV